MKPGYVLVRQSYKDLSYVNGTYQGNGFVNRNICAYVIKKIKASVIKPG